MRDIGKANFYKSYFLAGQKLSDNDRLSFYDSIFKYIFEEQEPAELEYVVDIVFTTIKPFIDADLKRKSGGAPLGNNNAETDISCRKCTHYSQCHREKRDGEVCGVFKLRNKTTQNNYQNSNKTNKVEVEEEVNVEEEVEVEVEVNDSTLLTTQTIIKNFASTHGFTFGNKTVKELSESLQFESDAWDSLNKQLAFVKSKYPNKRGDELAKLFVASLHWDRKKETEPAPELPKEKEKNPPPKKCPICNSKLIRSGMDQVLCGHCREKGKLVWWEKENGIWTRQDSETA